MSVAVITGVGGLVGSAAARHFHALGLDIVGIDNNGRAEFFGPESSIMPTLEALRRDLPRLTLHSFDVRHRDTIGALWVRYGRDIALVVHAAAQPSHDWSARDPWTDFEVNALGTLNVLEATRLCTPDAAVVVCSTNKVYGDLGDLPLTDVGTRLDWDSQGVHERWPIDQTMHSIFGTSKLAADVMAQEYGRYFGLRVGVFRGGCLTGPGHRGAELHGFLAYLVRCVARGEPYRVIGYGGKQVRDNLHAVDVAAAFEAFWRAPRPGEVYNLGGGRANSVSVLEALALAEEITGREAKVEFVDEARRGDHRWYITDMGKFREHYPGWARRYDLPTIVREIAEAAA